MRGLYRLNHAAQKLQAYEDYNYLLALALRHGLQDMIPHHTGAESAKVIDKKAWTGGKALLEAKPELKDDLLKIDPGWEDMYKEFEQ